MLENVTHYGHACTRATFSSKELLLLCTCAMTNLHLGHVTRDCFDFCHEMDPFFDFIFAKFCCHGRGYCCCLCNKPNPPAWPPESNKNLTRFWHACCSSKAMSGKNRRLVTMNRLSLRFKPVEVHRDFRRITDHFRGIYRRYLKWMKASKTGRCQHVTGWI